MMATITVNARFANGVLTPLEPLDFPEGALVVLNIQEPDAVGPDAPEASVDAEEDAGLLRAMLEVSIDDPDDFVSEAEVRATLQGLRASDGD